ncbi:MAG: GNAT family N-acetyltransferase [Syntrophales bacterium]|jgi:acetyltransferase|nr:GNAT family N-acetyltransferase [Syntrophales bacterium]
METATALNTHDLEIEKVSFEYDHNYPAQYEESITVGKERVFLRPVKPTDGPLILDLFGKLSPQSIFYRFLSHIKKLRPEQVYHLVHIDYVTEFALAAVIEDKGEERLVGVCRAIASSDRSRAELTVTIRDDWQGRGIGRIMTKKVMMVMQKHGISRIEIQLDSRNDKMKKLFMSLGYPYTYETSLLDICDRMELEFWPGTGEPEYVV